MAAHWDPLGQVVFTPTEAEVRARTAFGVAIERKTDKRVESRPRSKKEELPEPMLAFMRFLAVFLRCPPPHWRDVVVHAREVKSEFKAEAIERIESISKFAADAEVFVISRLWFDGISGAWWHLHAVPFCGGFLAIKCAEEASAHEQFNFALCLVPIGGLIKHIVESCPVPEGDSSVGSMNSSLSDGGGHESFAQQAVREISWGSWCRRCYLERGHKSQGKKLVSLPGFDKLPDMINYIVGWAFSFALEKWVKEMEAKHPELCTASATGGKVDCAWLEVGFAVAITLLSALLLLFIKPLTKGIDFGEGALVDWLEELLADTWYPNPNP